MGGLNVCRCQPRSRYARVEDKFIVESEPVNSFARAQKKFPTAQAHAILQEAGVKLDTMGFQGCLQPKESPVKEKIEKSGKKKVPREATERTNQLAKFWQCMEDQMETNQSYNVGKITSIHVSLYSLRLYSSSTNSSKVSIHS
jgi:hypothetical protein